jgi:hypothetical protein
MDFRRVIMGRMLRLEQGWSYYVLEKSKLETPTLLFYFKSVRIDLDIKAGMDRSKELLNRL